MEAPTETNEVKGRSEVVLSEPIMQGSEKIEVLSFRKAKAKDFRDMPFAAKTGDMLNLAGKLCGQPPSVIDQLSPKDMGEVLSLLGEFMGLGPATGDKD